MKIIPRVFDTEELPDGLAERLAALRRGFRLRQHEVAAAVGCATITVYRWESGRTCPDLERARRLAELYRVPVDVLTGPRPAAAVTAPPG